MNTKLKQKITNALRKIWNESELKNNFRKSVRFQVDVGEYKNNTKKYLFYFKCNLCGFQAACKDKKHHTDHITPVLDVKSGFQGFDVYIERLLLCDESNFQMLCKSCHKEKTNLERKCRKS